jgi:F0F1-type ATP synthase membrane subunit b/b'
MFLSPDGTAWVQLVNFAIFFALLYVVFLRPVSAAIKKRREYIDSLTTDYDRYQGEVRALHDEADAARANARRDADATISQLRGAASNEAAAISAEFEAKAQATVEHAERTVTEEVAKARENESALVQQLADLVVERTISESKA